MSAQYAWYVRVMEYTPNDTSPGLSRSGLLLGAAGAVGVAALTALPGTAAAATGPVRTTLRNTTKFSITTHPDYNRKHFDRAKAIAVVRNPATGKTMTLRVDDLVPLRSAVGAKVGSAEWSGGFTSLLTRTKGTPLDTGTYPTTINGRTFPLTIVRIGDNSYQVSVDRRKPAKGA
jgi:hypothetical protein